MEQWIDRETLMCFPKRNLARLLSFRQENIVFKDDSYICLTVTEPEELLEGEHSFEIVYLGDVVWFADDLTEETFNKANKFLNEFIIKIHKQLDYITYGPMVY